MNDQHCKKTSEAVGERPARPTDEVENGLHGQSVPASGTDSPASKPASHDAGQPIRAINEDDDGYDPYSDLHDTPASEPLFEPDPWN